MEQPLLSRRRQQSRHSCASKTSVVAPPRCPVKAFYRIVELHTGSKQFYYILSLLSLLPVLKLSLTYPICRFQLPELAGCEDRIWNGWGAESPPFWYLLSTGFLSFFWIWLAPSGVGSKHRIKTHGTILICIEHVGWMIVMIAFVAILGSWFLSLVTFFYILADRFLEQVGEDPDLYWNHRVWLSWIIVVAILSFRNSSLHLFHKIRKDFRKISPDVVPQRRFTLCLFWIYWSMGLIASALILAADMPQFFAKLPDVNLGHSLRMAFSCLVMWKKVAKMESQTPEGNDREVAESGLNDDIWALYARPCLICQWIMLASVAYTVWFEAYHLPPVLIWHYVLAMFIMGWTLFGWMVASAFAYRDAIHIHQMFWVVRRKSLRGNDPVDKRFLQVYVRTIAPSSLWDRFGLDERMARRLDDHCCQEWAASKGWKHFTVPDIMVEEVNLFKHPVVNDIDSYSKLMIWAVKYLTVEAGRLDPLFLGDNIEPPWEKQTIDTISIGVAGLEMALWDEQYSNAEKNEKRTESGYFFGTTLRFLHWAFPAVNKPRWFLHELEGVLTYEAVVAPFAASCNTHWSDFTSDEAIEMMAFYGILQFLLHGETSEVFKRTVKSEPFNRLDAPNKEDIKMLIDYSWISNYEVKEYHARYGFIACFTSNGSDKPGHLSHIYVSHWKMWVKRPKEKTPKDDEHKKRWEHAKFVIKATIGCGVTLDDHLLQCHWIVANTASLGLRTHLNKHHPIRRLMHIFVLRTASINYASTMTLLPEDRFVHRAAGFEYNGMGACLNDCARRFKFETFPDVVESRGLDADLLPWAQDGLKFWDVVRRFVAVYVNMFYETDKDVERDAELQDFWTMVMGIPSGPPGYTSLSGCSDGFGYKLPHLKCETTSSGHCAKSCKDRLIDYLSHVIFWVTANHEYYGALAEYFISPMGLTTKLWDETYEKCGLDQGGQVMADIQTYMQSLCIVSSTGYPQPRLMAQWDFMMHSHKDGEKLCLSEEQKEKARTYIGILNESQTSEYDVDQSLAMSYNTSTDLSSFLGSPVYQDHTRSRSGTSFEPKDTFTQVRSGHLDLDSCVKDKMSRDEQNNLLSKFHLAFMEELWRLDCDINDQNQKRKRPFEAFRPGNLECSVNI